MDWLNVMLGRLRPQPTPTAPVVPTTPVAAPGGTLQASPVAGCTYPTWKAYEALLRDREGVVNEVYPDSLGKLTAGIGHLMLPEDGPHYDRMPVSPEQVSAWFTKDGAAAMTKAVELAKQAGITSQEFLPYLASVCFQMGLRWTDKFPNTWKMIVNGQYERAAMAFNGTLWQAQTPTRVTDFQKALRALPQK